MMASHSRYDQTFQKQVRDLIDAKQSHLDGQERVRISKLEPYRYTQLERSQSVRLLQVSLSEGPIGHTFLTMLRCKIRHYDLTDQPLYTAVSYTWGSESGLTDLDVEGKSLSVRSNVATMLKQLAKLHQWRTLWVDAVCIDQDNVQERNTQVRLMGTIFAKANFVLSWLHPIPSNPLRSLVTTSSLRMVSAIANTGSRVEPFPLVDIQNMIREFFQHPYWRRRWVIQEVALARSVQIVSPGRNGKLDQLPLGSLESFYQNFGRFTSLKPSESNTVLQSPVRHFLVSRLRQRTGDESLMKLLVTYKDSQCSDVRDKIFALASLSNAAKAHLEIDYTASPTTIFFSVLRFAFAYESLSCGGIVGLLWHLKRQLMLTRRHLLYAYNMPQFGDVFQQLARIVIYTRGYVGNDSVDPQYEACVHKCQDFVHALRGLQTPSLQLHGQPDGSNAMKFSKTTQGLLNETVVSGQDLCVFTFAQSSTDPTKTFPRMGLASSWVEPRDEVWQFPDTPVALIARREMDVYTIVARALIIKSMKNVEYLTQTASNFNWSTFLGYGSFLQEGQPSGYEEKPLRVSFGVLLDILEWVDDADSYLQYGRSRKPFSDSE